MRSNLWASGYDVDGTDQTSVGQLSGRVQLTYKHSVPRFFVPEHGTMFTLALVRFPPTATKEIQYLNVFFFSSRRRHTRCSRDWSSDVCSSDLLRSLDPVSNSVSRNTLPFPFNIRLSMSGWNTLFFTPGTFAPDPKRSAEFNRGAYLIEGLGHCGACHTPFNAFGANKADRYLQGNQIDSWTAPNIT